MAARLFKIKNMRKFFLFSASLSATLIAGGIIFCLDPPAGKLAGGRTPAEHVACCREAKIQGLENSANASLRKLSQYQTACDSLAFNEIMVFAYIPGTVNAAGSEALKMSAALKEFSKYGISPIVVMEPGGGTDVVNFRKFAAGDYDAVMDAYFSALKNGGVCDREMGVWVPFPEPNIDAWGRENADPSSFILAFNKFAALYKKHFPGAELSVLINSQTYDWKTGDYSYADIAPYINGLDKKNLASFGLQGFPWAAPPGSDGGSDIEASSFINHAVAAEAARSLGLGSVWFNTGTFSTINAGDGKTPAAAGPELRGAILEDILSEAVAAESQGLGVSVNIFAQNKSSDTEGVNWSYWSGGPDGNNPDQSALVGFIAKARQAGIDLSLFDTE